jgi:hypothetical protein
MLAIADVQYSAALHLRGLRSGRRGADVPPRTSAGTIQLWRPWDVGIRETSASDLPAPAVFGGGVGPAVLGLSAGGAGSYFFSASSAQKGSLVLVTTSFRREADAALRLNHHQLLKISESIVAQTQFRDHLVQPGGMDGQCSDLRTAVRVDCREIDGPVHLIARVSPWLIKAGGGLSRIR